MTKDRAVTKVRRAHKLIRTITLVSSFGVKNKIHFFPTSLKNIDSRTHAILVYPSKFEDPLGQLENRR